MAHPNHAFLEVEFPEPPPSSDSVDLDFVSAEDTPAHDDATPASWSVSPGSLRMSFNENYRALMGQPPTALPGDLGAFMSVIHPEDCREFRRRLQAVLDGTANEFTMEHRLRHAELDWIWVLSRGGAVRERGGAGGVRELRGYSIDITDRKSTEDTLRDALSQTESLLHEAPAAIAVLHEDIITFGNQAFSGIFGHPMRELVGRDIKRLVVDGEHWSRVVLGMTDTQSTTAPREETVRFRRGDGSVFTARVSGRRLRAEADSVVSFTDITRLVEISAALEQAKDAAEAASQAKSRFLATISHEIRTPMNGVIGLLELLETAPLGATEKSSIKVARESADQLLSVMNDIIDYSRTDSDEFATASEALNIREAASRSLETCRTMAQRKGLSLQMDVQESVPLVVILDGPRVCRVIGNLVSNAVKFTTVGSVQLHIDMSATEGGAQALEIQVRDSGPGIPDKDRQMLFEPFVQFGTHSTRRHDGTGLGLAICKKLVEAMDGTISMESTVGIGTVVRVMLPVGTLHAPEPRAATSPATVAQGGLDAPARVLLVEDNPVGQMVLKKQLTHLGYIVEVAGNGLEGLQQWRRYDFDLILCDCHMPEMDGYEMARTLRAEEASRGAGRHLPVIGCTASFMDEEIMRCLTAGMNDVLSKPVQLREMETVLARWIRLARMQARSGDHEPG